MRFIAAIPNYNHGASLVKLLDQLLEEDIDEIYVLDDGSTDDSLKLLKPYENKVNIIRGPFNIGPGGNRNRIIPYLEPGDILMFVDADMELVSHNVRNPILKLFKSQSTVAIFGGGIETKNNEPMTYNYGLHQSQRRHGFGLGLEKMTAVIKFKPFIDLVRPLARKFTYNVEILYYEPVERSVDSVSEGHFYVRGDVFTKFGGFNDALRYHEGGELAYRIKNEGYDIKFTPVVWVRHLQIHPRSKLRAREAKKIDKIIKNENEL